MLPVSTTTVNPFVNDRDVLAGNATFNCTGNKAITDLLITRIILCVLYVTIFSIAVVGNSLVVYVVIINKDMQSATNLFITNLAMSDLLVNFTSLWLTPIYTYVGHWVWGSWLCYGLPLFQGTSIFISTLTLMAIAIDRYFVICRGPVFGYDLRTHMSLQLCFAIITLIWTISVLLVMPYAVHMRMIYIPEPCNFWLCIEDWTMDDLKSFYGIIVALLQFIVPFIIIGKSYCQIYFFLRDRTSLVKPRNATPTPLEEQRRRRLLRMLFTMVMLFAVCWAPFNFLNISRDLHIDGFMKPYFSIFFLSAHVISMTATCWNPLVYAWMNETFREKFIIVWPWLARFSSEPPRRPRYITECRPAANRINCSDIAAPVGSKKNLGSGRKVTLRQPLVKTDSKPSATMAFRGQAGPSSPPTEDIEMNEF
uniref:G_PROTEIN_RECEP_F1_2 domain-containing protein n=1 Tax=Steinernema glaseri TaxID=37863 RepID=A0A1I7Z3J1_9BILA